MKPYFEDKGITIYHGDCLEVLPSLALVDACITDPPYGTTACAWDTVIPFAPMWAELKRIVKPKGAIVLFGSQPFTSALVMSNPTWFRYEWVWEKEKPSNIFFRENQPMRYHEDVVVFSASGASNCSASQMCYSPQMVKRNENNKRRNSPRVEVNDGIFGVSRVFNNSASRGADDFIFPNAILKFTSERVERAHPTQKPVALLRYLIRTYTDAGDVILDFTCGSGTTLRAAKDLGRKAIGIEIEEKYCEIAAKRLSQEVLNFEAVA